MKRLNAYVLNKRSEPTFVLEQKPNNVGLSAKKMTVPMIEFSEIEEPFVLPDEFCAKEIDEHQIGGARDLENTEKTLEVHHMAKRDIVHVKKSPRFSNTTGKVTFTGNLLISQFNVSKNNSCISNIVMNNSKGLIGEIKLLIGNKMFKFFISSLPKFMSTWFACDQSRDRGTKLKLENIDEVDANIADSSKSSDKGNISDCVAKWVDSTVVGLAAADTACHYNACANLSLAGYHLYDMWAPCESNFGVCMKLRFCDNFLHYHCNKLKYVTNVVTT